MFASIHNANQMTWHRTNIISSGMMRHPFHGETCKYFDRIHPDFAVDAINVILGLFSDGFTPYIQASTIVNSCWYIIVTPYNISP